MITATIRALCRSIHQDHKSNIAYLLIFLCNVLIEQAIEGDFQRSICVYQELFCFQEKKLCQRIKANNGQREANLISPEVSVTKRDGACLTGANSRVEIPRFGILRTGKSRRWKFHHTYSTFCTLCTTW